MATHLLGGLQRAHFDLTQICITDKDGEKLQQLAKQFHVQTQQDNITAIKGAQMVILAIKPQSLGAFAKECAGAFTHSPLVISILAGISIAQLSQLLGPQLFIRAMPNILVSLSQGNTILFSPSLPKEAHQQVQDFFARLGATQWIQTEAQLDAYTVLTGCGPGYVFFLMQCVIDAAAELNIPENDAKNAVLQLFSGAAQMAAQSPHSLQTLQQQVASKGGVTEKLLATLQDDHLEKILKHAFIEAYAHGQQLQHHQEEK